MQEVYVADDDGCGATSSQSSAPAFVTGQASIRSPVKITRALEDFKDCAPFLPEQHKAFFHKVSEDQSQPTTTKSSANCRTFLQAIPYRIYPFKHHVGIACLFTCRTVVTAAMLMLALACCTRGASSAFRVEVF